MTVMNLFVSLLMVSVSGGKFATHFGTVDESDRVAATADQICPLKVGTQIPNVVLRNMDGSSIDLATAAKVKPSILIFYRGGWCPYCNMHLKQLKDVESELIRLGFQLLAVSPDQPAKLSESVQKHSLNYTLLSDSKMDAAKAFGIAYKVDEKVVERYKHNNMDLELASGETHHLLPVPAVFIANTEGVVKFSFADPDYRVRIDPELFLAAAKAALEKTTP